MKLIREQDDFNWINNDNNLNGVKIKTPVGKTVITIIDDGGRTVLLTWGEGGRYSSEYDRKTVESFIARGTWTLTESTDDFDWIRDIEPGIELKPNTMYYFEPKLTIDEVERFANVISNSDYLKNWMLTKVISRMSGDRLGDNMSYFVTNDSIDEMVSGWCLTSNPHSMSRSTYRDYDFVDARKRFNI